MLSERQKLILLADKSEFGWKTVEQYTQQELADNEKDGKKIRRTEERAEKALKSTTSKRPINESSSLSCPSSSSRFSSQYSRLSSLSFGSFRNQRDQLSYPRSPRQGPVIVSSAAGLAIGGPNALSSPTLFLKVFQVIYQKRVQVFHQGFQTLR